MAWLRAHKYFVESMSPLFFGIAIKAGFLATWEVCVIFRPITRIVTWGCVDCNNACDSSFENRTGTRQRCSRDRLHRFWDACAFARLRVSNSFMQFQRTAFVLTLQILLREGISDSVYEMINNETKLVVDRKVEVRARAHNSSSVLGQRLRSGLSETLQRG